MVLETFRERAIRAIEAPASQATWPMWRDGAVEWHPVMF
jgi:hypothetical protein|tara:strand:+ start:794 stop:910 length:117 start_codon:yes stop_codon:yes gene_type:complete